MDSRSHSAEFSPCLRKINDREAALLCGDEDVLDKTISLEETREYGTMLYRRSMGGEPPDQTIYNRIFRWKAPTRSEEGKDRTMGGIVTLVGMVETGFGIDPAGRTKLFLRLIDRRLHN